MLALLFGWIVAAAAGLFAYFRWHFSRWRRQGISGPPPMPFLGNSVSLTDTKEPAEFQIKAWSKKFGKGYGIYEGIRRTLVISDADSVYDLLVKKHASFNMRKQPLAEHWAMRTLAAKCTLGASGSGCARLRRLTDQSETDSALKRVFEAFNGTAKASLAVQAIAAAISKTSTMDINMITNEFVVDILARLTMGQEGVRICTTGYCTALYQDFQRPLSLVEHAALAFPRFAPFFHSVNDLLEWPFYDALSHIRSRIEQHVDAKWNAANEGGENISAGKQRTDLVDILLEAAIDGKGTANESTKEEKLSRDEIVAHCVSLFATAHVASSTMTMIGFYLATHADIQQRCLAEINQACKEEITFDTLQNLRFVDCVIKEVQRLHPFCARFISRHCTRRTTLGDVDIAPGVDVQVDVLSLHCDSKWWGSDAGQFKPSRWAREDSSRHPAAFLGDGGICARHLAGQRLWNIAMKTGFAHILKAIEIVKVRETTSKVRMVGTLATMPSLVYVAVNGRGRDSAPA